MTAAEFLYSLAAIEREMRIAAWFRSTPTSPMAWSLGMYELLGIHPSVPASDKLYLQGIHPDDQLAAHGSVFPNEKAQQEVEQVFRVVRPDGSIRPVRSMVFKESLQDQVPLYLGLLFDEPRGRYSRDLAAGILAGLGFLRDSSIEAHKVEANEVTELAPFTQLDPSLVRAARGLLDWSANDLAEAAGVSFSTVRRAEGGTKRAIRHQSGETIRKTLERRGLRFIRVGSLKGLLFQS